MEAIHSQTRLAPTLMPLLASDARGDEIRAGCDRLHAAGFRWVQLSVMHSGLRPRDLDQSGRRDLLATLRRRELDLAGLDLWIPPHHFIDPSKQDRAFAALNEAVELAADLGRVPLSIVLPATSDDGLNGTTKTDRLEAELANSISHAERFGVPLADHQSPPSGVPALGLGIDPALWLARGIDPGDAVMANAQRLMTTRLSDITGNGRRVPLKSPHGLLDVLKYQAALSVVGYSQPVVVDAREWENPWRGLDITVEAWVKAVAHAR